LIIDIKNGLAFTLLAAYYRVGICGVVCFGITELIPKMIWYDYEATTGEPEKCHVSMRLSNCLIGDCSSVLKGEKYD